MDNNTASLKKYNNSQSLYFQVIASLRILRNRQKALKYGSTFNIICFIICFFGIYYSPIFYILLPISAAVSIFIDNSCKIAECIANTSSRNLNKYHIKKAKRRANKCLNQNKLDILKSLIGQFIVCSVFYITFAHIAKLSFLNYIYVAIAASLMYVAYLYCTEEKLSDYR